MRDDPCGHRLACPALPNLIFPFYGCFLDRPGGFRRLLGNLESGFRGQFHCGLPAGSGRGRRAVRQYGLAGSKGCRDALLQVQVCRLCRHCLRCCAPGCRTVRALRYRALRCTSSAVDDQLSCNIWTCQRSRPAGAQHFSLPLPCCIESRAMERSLLPFVPRLADLRPVDSYSRGSLACYSTRFGADIRLVLYNSVDSNKLVVDAWRRSRHDDRRAYCDSGSGCLGHLVSVVSGPRPRISLQRSLGAPRLPFPSNGEYTHGTLR